MPDAGVETQQSIDPSSQYPQQGIRISDDVIKWQLEPLAVLVEIEYYLKGFYFDDKTKCWKQTGHSLMNDVGVNTIITYLRSGPLNKNVVQGNFDGKTVRQQVLNMKVALIGLFFSNWRNYNIDKTNLPMIVDMISIQVYAFLSRTIDDGERKRHNINYSVGQNIMRNESDQKKGWKLPFMS